MTTSRPIAPTPGTHSARGTPGPHGSRSEVPPLPASGRLAQWSGVASRLVVRVAIGAVPVFLLLPFVGIVIASFSRGGALSFASGDWTLHWYRAIAPGYYDALRYSVAVGAGTTLLSAVLGVPLALTIARARHRLTAWLSAVCLAPLAVPTIVIAVAGFKFLLRVSDWHDLGLVGTPAAIVLLQTVFTLPLVVRAVVANFAHYDNALDEAAQNLGATPRQVFWRVTVPLILPGIAAGMLFALVMSFDDVVVAWFLGDPGTPTLPVKLFNALEVDFDNAVTALSTLIVGFWALLMLLAQRFLRLDRFLAPR
ncbi:ABC transporter permease [Paraburkholderia xenovorans]|uniref:ABC transporter permease n=1 Tax=Paraburkholderia xenovorans TaxID=36873 RepID=UPI0015584DFE|nr:ABC transporter permease [Paraburkholderia xenovorans]NPT39121.1 ABC transporter permease subunit [Paraburkholderia xenovorans]